MIRGASAPSPTHTPTPFRSVPPRCVALRRCAVWLLAAGAACAGPQASPTFRPSPPSGSDQAGSALESGSARTGGASPARLAPADGRAYTLAELLELAETRSPALAAARSRRAAASGRRDQAGAWSNPRLEFEAEEIPTRGQTLGEAKTTLGLEQAFDLAGRRRAAVAVGDAELRLETSLLDGLRRRLRGQICLDWIELQHLREELTELEGAVLAAESSEELARRRFEARAVPESELLRAGVELERLRLDLAARKGSMSPLIRGLSARLGGLELDPGSIGSGGFAALPELELEALRAAAIESHPEMAAARERQRAADRRLELAERERWPELGVHLAWGRVGATDESIWELGFGFALPLWNQNQGRRAEGRALAAASRHQTDLLRGELLADLEEQWAACEQARFAVDRYQQVLVPAAHQAAEQTAARYRSGAASLLELLDAQRSRTRARLGLADARRRAELALVRLWILAAPAVVLPGVEA